jgi:hypothetical protein
MLRVKYSSEIALNWLGAPINSLRTLLASSIAVIKSLILNPKLIFTFAQPRYCIRWKAESIIEDYVRFTGGVVLRLARLAITASVQVRVRGSGR